jgi:hypothetical protein
VTCPSRFAIAQLPALDATPPSGAARAPDLAGHLRSCARCRDALGQLESARRDLLGDDPAAAATAAARRLLAAAGARRRARRRGFLWRGLPLSLAAAAAVFALWAAPSRGIRAKGDLAIEVYCKRGEVVFVAQDGGEFLAGDRLRFAYSAAEPGYLVVFGVDDAGAIFPYYPQRDLRGIKVNAGQKVLLPGSIELDAHRGWERTYALWSRAPFDERALRDRIGDSLRAAHGDVRRAGRLALDLPQVSHLLRRP